MGLWPASGFESRRGKMEPSTDQFLVDKFLKNQNIYSDLTQTVRTVERDIIDWRFSRAYPRRAS